MQNPFQTSKFASKLHQFCQRYYGAGDDSEVDPAIGFGGKPPGPSPEKDGEDSAPIQCLQANPLHNDNNKSLCVANDKRHKYMSVFW